MKNKLILLVFLVSLTLFFCTTADKEDATHIDVVEKYKPINFSDYFELVDSVQIEIHGDFFVSDFPRIIPGASGKFVVIDRRFKKVSLFAENGKFIKQLGRYGSGPGEFLYPIFGYVEQDSSYQIFDRDMLNFIKYDSDGMFIGQKNFGEFIDNFAVNSQGEVYFYTEGFFGKIFNNIIQYKNQSSKVKFGEIKVKPMDIPPVAGGGIMFDGSDNLYCVTAYNYSVIKYNKFNKKIGEYRIRIQKNPHFIHLSPNVTKVDPYTWIKSFTPITVVQSLDDLLMIGYINKERVRFVDLFSVETDNFNYLGTIEIPGNRLSGLYAYNGLLYRIVPSEIREMDDMYVNPCIYKYMRKSGVLNVQE